MSLFRSMTSTIPNSVSVHFSQTQVDIIHMCRFALIRWLFPSPSCLLLLVYVMSFIGLVVL